MPEPISGPRILIICDYYLPGYKSGGALRSLVSLLERFGSKFDFRIITRDHDGKMSRVPYDTVEIDKWNIVDGNPVFYLSSDNIRFATIARLIREVEPDVLFLNSFFSPLTTMSLLLCKLGRVPKVPIILAPEGELSDGAMSIKPIRKKLFKIAAKFLRIHHRVSWKVASETEHREVEKLASKGDSILLAPTMLPKMILPDYKFDSKPEKAQGSVKLVFLSRYMRKKNMNWLLEKLSGHTTQLELDIYGPLEEQDYWSEAETIIGNLPSNIIVRSAGSIPHENVAETLTKYHFFVLPTLGENFGIAIIEALAAGCPVIISDRTPWQNLQEKGIGWDLPLESPNLWFDVLDKCSLMSSDEFKEYSDRSRQFAVNWLQDPSLDAANLNIFERALGSKGE